MDVITELGPSAIAAMCRCKAPSVVEWRKRGIPPERCVQIESASAGKYTCEAMRPDVCWHRVPDPTWPHPNGRPLIDVAAGMAAADQQREAA
jgi:hypothetical protein